MDAQLEAAHETMPGGHLEGEPAEEEAAAGDAETIPSLEEMKKAKGGYARAAAAAGARDSCGRRVAC